MPHVSDPAVPRSLVSDLDGVLYLGGEAIPGAAAAFRSIMDAGWQVLFATNNSTRTPEKVAEHMETAAGLVVDPAAVITSGMAAASLLCPEDSPALIVGEIGLREVVERTGCATTEDPREARSVIVGLDRTFDYETLARAFTALDGGARFIASNTDVTFPTPSGPVPGAGASVAAIAAATGRSPEVAGKPHSAMQDVLCSRLGPGAVWVVGDRAETDLALGTAMGWQRILVLTGIVSDPRLVPAEHRPDHVIDSAADLARLLL